MRYPGLVSKIQKWISESDLNERIIIDNSRSHFNINLYVSEEQLRHKDNVFWHEVGHYVDYISGYTSENLQIPEINSICKYNIPDLEGLFKTLLSQGYSKKDIRCLTDAVGCMKGHSFKEYYHHPRISFPAPDIAKSELFAEVFSALMIQDEPFLDFMKIWMAESFTNCLLAINKIVSNN